MVNIAILGFGVVGGGIAEVIEKNREAIKRYTGEEVNVKYILDRLDFPDSPLGDRVVRDISIITDDPDVSIVCETMGSVHPAFEFSMSAINAGKSVITSNKELVAKCGDELLSAAAKNGVSYLFEAAVGGGIPEIRSLRTSLAADSIVRLDGIMNGTTNYILTKMKNEGADFADTLKQAQALGYAEANPAADVDGLDVQRKIMILTAVVTGKLVDESAVYTEGISKITTADINAASLLGASVKLVGTFRQEGEKAFVYVCPSIVRNSSPLSYVDDVYNAIFAESAVTGDVMYYGRGAGRFPTAGAVVSDIASVISKSAPHELDMRWKKTDDFVLNFDECEFAYYIRVKTDSAVEETERARLIFGDIEPLPRQADGYAEFVTPVMKEKALRAALAEAELICESVIRIR